MSKLFVRLTSTSAFFCTQDPFPQNVRSRAKLLRGPLSSAMLPLTRVLRGGKRNATLGDTFNNAAKC
jgi:hypothetical protein